MDVWLEEQVPALSRARIQALIRAGEITVDAQAIRPHRKVRRDDLVHVRIPAPKPARLDPEDIPLDVRFEDEDIIVVNKPPGLVVHPAAGHASGTLVNALLAHCRDLRGIGGELRPGIVHRLDKDTSGVMVAAKNEPAMRALVEQFKTGAVRKEYAALLHGVPCPGEGRICAPIGRDPRNRKKMAAAPRTGRPAVTLYRVVETFDAACRACIRIETGRTHQIRVHMAHLGHPVIGDRQYGNRRDRRARLRHPCIDAPRQMLHAERLGLQHPRSGARMEFWASPPADWQTVLAGLRVSA